MGFGDIISGITRNPLFGMATNTLGGGLMGSIGSGLITDFFGDANARDQFQRSQSLMNQQASVNESMFRNRYQWTMEDMRKAGLNPILAVAGSGMSVGGSGPSVGLATPTMAPQPDFTAVATSAKGLEEAESETARRRELFARASAEVQKAAESFANVWKIGAEAALLYSKNKTEIELAKKAVQDVRESAKRVGQINLQMELTQEEIERVRWLTEKLQLDYARMKAELERIQKLGGIYGSKAGWLLTSVETLMRSVGGPLAGAAVGAYLKK